MRLTNIHGVCHGLPRTTEGVKEAIRKYEQTNSDLPQPARRLLALAAVGRFFGRTLMELALDSPLPRFPFRDWAWRWWNVLELSGLGDEWDAFKTDATTKSVCYAATNLRKRVRSERYLLFLRRAGTNPHNNHRQTTGGVLWTKGGCWRKESPYTKILVQKTHLPQRPLFRRWHLRLGHRGVEQVERELMRLIDPDKMLVHEAKQLALSYAASRIRELLGWKAKVGPKMLAWFFQTPIQTKKGTLVPVSEGRYTIHRRSKKPGPLTW